MDANIYSDNYIDQILSDVDTIALVGASSDPDKDSYKVMKFLLEKNYQVFPINPNEAGMNILGQYCYADLSSVTESIDMVEVFRRSEAVFDIAKDAISIGAKVLWTQLGVVHEEAAQMAQKAGLKVVMNKCPKIELQR
tara:strand:- start:1570 stop:1983 length:414 start_codon:yes stop_codon:yes gene_type:complete